MSDTTDAVAIVAAFGAAWAYSWAGGHIRGVDLFRVLDGKVAEKFAYVKG